MAEVVHNDKLLIHFFQDSLTGSTLSWYMMLNNARIKKWSDLVYAFLRQYKFNIDIALNRTSLIIMEKNNKETLSNLHTMSTWWEALLNIFFMLLLSPKG